jgi:quercetin dioxygenase-like cupin family protein
VQGNIIEPSESASGLVVQATEEGYVYSLDTTVDWGVDVDPRDQTWVQELISGRRSGSNDLCIGLGRMMPGEYHIKHHHPDGSEFYYFITGECITYVDGEDIRCRPGTTIYLPPNCVHAVRNDTDEVAEMLYGINKPEYSQIGLVYDE